MAKRNQSTDERLAEGPLNRKQRRELQRLLNSADPGLEVVHRDAAGIDIGNASHFAAVPADRDEQPVRGIRLLDSRFAGDGHLAEAVRYPDGGDAVDRGVLDRGAGGAGTAGVGSVPGECPVGPRTCQDARAACKRASG
jgi:hypothetical protein